MLLHEGLSKQLLPEGYSVVVSSFTNLAVDRVLLILVDLGFEKFVRIGNQKSISKGLLRFTLKSSEQDSRQDANDHYMEDTKSEVSVHTAFLIGKLSYPNVIPRSYISVICLGSTEWN